jgi:ABC-type antimicrobial peptide transport system permease subunit
VRTEGESAEVATQVRGAVVALGRDVPILSMRTIEAFYHSNARNLNTVIVRTIAGMGIMGLGLALVGLYGLTAYAVSRRTREIGIRMALGARGVQVLRLVVAGSLRPVLGGLVLGSAGALFAARLLGVLLFQVQPGDPGVLGAIAAILGGAAIVASLVPARRASMVDPMTALKEE